MLDRLAELYVLSRPDLSADYAKNVLKVCRACSADCRGSLEYTELASWLRSQLGRFSAPTVARYRRIINAVLRWAYVERHVDKLIVLPRVRVEQRLPEAWSVDDIRRLLAEAEKQPGQIGCHPAGLWWTALLETLYWTGARVGAVLAATLRDWDASRRILYLRNSKGRRYAAYVIHERTAEKVTTLANASRSVGHDRIFAWPFSRHYFFRRLRRLVEKAGIAYRPGAFRLTHSIRRACASYLWRRNPVLAQRHLDHTDPRVTFSHYVDPRIANTERDATGVLPFPWG